MQAYLLMYTGNKMHGKLNSVCPLKKSEIGSGKIGNRPIIKIKRSESDRDPKNVIGTSLIKDMEYVGIFPAFEVKIKSSYFFKICTLVWTFYFYLDLCDF